MKIGPIYSIYFLLIISFFIFNSQLYGQGQMAIENDYQYETFKNDGTVLNYRMLLPNNFDPSKKYPLVIFLHGMGERGTDNNTQLAHGSKLFKDSMDKYPAIVIFPQCPPTDYWANLTRPNEGGRNRQFKFNLEEDPKPSLAAVIYLINSKLAEKFIDNDRLYISGLSMGGFGAFELMWRIPEKIAAALPICGGASRESAIKMTQYPVWIFHGVDDSVVHPRFSMSMVKAIQQAGGKAKISLYPGVDHNSWDNAFNEPDYLKWMFSKKKN